MTIIEVDGINTTPHVVDAIQIFAGQRYSFVLNANQDVGNYWMRANPNVGSTGFAGGINSAVLRYIGADDADPTTTQATPAALLLEKDLVPLENPGAVSPCLISLNTISRYELSPEQPVTPASTWQ
jgi:iron transport multicopper oxidase